MPNRIIVPPPFVISKEQSELFTHAILNTLTKLPLNDLLQLYLFKAGNLVVSFDADYKPFIGRTHGFNQGYQRLYLNPNNEVIGFIAIALEAVGRNIHGGRVFINKDCAYIYNGMQWQTFITFYWKEEDPFAKIIDTYAKMLLNNIPTRTKPMNAFSIAV